MGTRADFYIGRGKQAEWLGSIAWDGFPDSIDASVLEATTEHGFRAAISAFLKREDATLPDQGWPWPWEDSRTTDYAYAFDAGKVWACPFGHYWFPATEEDPQERVDSSGTDEEFDGRKQVFPNMKALAKVTMGKRSGLLVIGPNGPEDLP